jgi:peptidoglycan/LPS O-acetylase OafA/YrhL
MTTVGLAAHRDPRGRIPELDGLRGIAIAMVLLYHLFQLTLVARPGSWLAHLQTALSLGWSGVDLFFVLSGFLIGGILLDARESTNYFRVFYTRRFFRIVPIYAVVLLVVPGLIFVAQRATRGDFFWLSNGPLPWYSYWVFLQNFWMAKRETLGANGLAITWSLAVEEQFYLTLPLVVRVLSRPQLQRFALAGCCLAPVLRLGLLLYRRSWCAAFVLMPCRADALLLGVLAAILLRDVRWSGRIQKWKLVWFIAFPVLLLGIALLTLKSPHMGDPLMQIVGYSWLALFYASVLLFALTHSTSALSGMLRMKWLGWIGAIAYGVYLIHQTVQGMLFGLCSIHEPSITGVSSLLIAFSALVATLVIAKLSWRYFESPLVRLGHRAKYLEPTEKAVVCAD